MKETNPMEKVGPTKTKDPPTKHQDKQLEAGLKAPLQEAELEAANLKHKADLKLDIKLEELLAKDMEALLSQKEAHNQLRSR